MPIETPNHAAPDAATLDPPFRDGSKKADRVDESVGDPGDPHLLLVMLVPLAAFSGEVLRGGGGGCFTVALCVVSEAPVGDVGEPQALRPVDLPAATAAVDGEALCEEAGGGNFSEAGGSTHVAEVFAVVVAWAKGFPGEPILVGTSIANGLRGELPPPPTCASPTTPISVAAAATATADFVLVPSPFLLAVSAVLSRKGFRDATGLEEVVEAVVGRLLAGPVLSGTLSKVGHPSLVLQDSPPVNLYRVSRDSRSWGAVGAAARDC